MQETTEKTTENNGAKDNKDYKYVMQDTGNIYIGVRFSYRELIEDENVPFKFKAIVERYIKQDLEWDVTVESHIYYMKPEGFDFQSYKQLRTKVKYNELCTKKNLLGQTSRRYVTKVLPIEKFADIALEQKKKNGIMIQEISISKLGLMTFTL